MTEHLTFLAYTSPAIELQTLWPTFVLPARTSLLKINWKWLSVSFLLCPCCMPVVVVFFIFSPPLWEWCSILHCVWEDQQHNKPRVLRHRMFQPDWACGCRLLIYQSEKIRWWCLLAPSDCVESFARFGCCCLSTFLAAYKGFRRGSGGFTGGCAVKEEKHL